MENELKSLEQLQIEMETNPIIGKYAFLKKIVSKVTRFLYCRLLAITRAIISSLNTLTQTVAQHQAELAKLRMDVQALDQAIQTLQEQEIERQKKMAEASEKQSVPPTVSRYLQFPEDVVAAEPPHPMSIEESRAFINSFPFWYHRIYLGNGVYTSDQRMLHEGVWNSLKAVFPGDLQGASVLDVGCNAGYFALKLKALGAGRVLGLESVENYYRQAQRIRSIWDADIEYRMLDVHSMGQIEEKFDIILFLGILYHLKNPFQVLELAGSMCKDALLLETEVIPTDPRNVLHVTMGANEHIEVVPSRGGFMKFVEGAEINNDNSNWWIPDVEAVFGMLRVAGFKNFSAPFEYGGRRLMLAASKRNDSILNVSAL